LGKRNSQPESFDHELVTKFLQDKSLIYKEWYPLCLPQHPQKHPQKPLADPNRPRSILPNQNNYPNQRINNVRQQPSCKSFDS
jgi:hypothetical protein